MSDKIDTFLSMLESGNDNSLLRYSLANEYLKMGDVDKARLSITKAIELQENYSAAWKLYGKILTEQGDLKAAAEVYEKGIEIAEANGDKQAVKEMQVFLKRLQKQIEH